VSVSGERQLRQDLVDNAVASLTRLLDAMAKAERASASPEKWDEEYAGAAISTCVDRLYYAPEAGFPKPSDGELRRRWHAAAENAEPFLMEDVPLPGSDEEAVLARAVALYAERWPSDDPGGAWADLTPDDAVRVAILLEA
jgi:hypothetical protein